MEKIQSVKDCSIALGRVTTDAVHRRFRSGKNTDNVKSKDVLKSEENDDYFCKQCNLKLHASPGKEQLKSHFESVKHNQYCACVYCSKPVYVYHCKGKMEVYHKC